MDVVGFHAAAIGALALLFGCNGDGPDDRTPVSGLTAGAVTHGPGGTGGGTSGAASQSTGESDGGLGGDGAKFDVGEGYCVGLEAGTYCSEGQSVVCDGSGGTVSTANCGPDPCLEGQGCVECLANQWTCKGPRVMRCNTQAQPQWEQVEVCDASALQFCDISSLGCAPLTPIGGTQATGEYYLYSNFATNADGFDHPCDVDTHGNRIYFTAMQAGQLVVGAYDVSLLDTDGDGLLEPHQHPDYAEQQGPIEERVFTFVESFPVDNNGASPNQMELHATATHLWWAGPTQVTRYDLATGQASVEALAPPWIASHQFSYLAFLGYDEVNDVWYSGNESARRVFQYDAETQTWGYAFEFPALSGDHMDGMEVVADPRTGVPYVYVSDMTSNFIGQYRHDPDIGWVQENLFTYNEGTGAPVEGFGFGANSHFWVGGWESNSFYEIGGGDLTVFTDPEG